MQRIITFILLIISIKAYNQTSDTVEQKLKQITSIEQLNELRESYVDWQIDVVEANLNESKFDSTFMSLEKGEVKTVKEIVGTFTYKVMEVSNVKEFRVSHIYLNGNELSMTEIDSLRKMIIEKHNKGFPFSSLSKQYASYKKPNNGDLGWFKENAMVDDFENAVKKHEKGDIFIVDIPDKGWYYVVLKTFDDRESRILKMIRVKCNN